MDKRQSGFVSFIVFTISLSYIIAEIWLNTKLLDAFGTWKIEPADIEKLEHYGRIISGVGFGMLAWKAFGRKIGILIIPFLVAGSFFMSWFQPFLIDHFVQKSTPEDRKITFMMGSVATSMASKGLELEGFNLPPSEFSKPEGKAFIAIVPALSFIIPSFKEELPKHADGLASAFVAKTVPDLQAACDGMVGASNNMRKLYNADYLSATDQVIEHGATQRVMQTYNERGFKIFNDFPPPPGLSWKEFSKHKAVRKLLDDKLLEAKLPREIIQDFNMDMDCKTLERKIYNPKVKEMTAKAKALILDDASRFDKDGAKYKEGMDAYRMAVVPMISLLMSAMFGSLNLILLIVTPVLVLLVKWSARNYMERREKLIQGALTVVAFVLVIAIPLSLNNQITNSEAFKRLSGDGSGVVMKTSLQWIINAQPYVYNGFLAIAKPIEYQLCLHSKVRSEEQAYWAGMFVPISYKSPEEMEEYCQARL